VIFYDKNCGITRINLYWYSYSFTLEFWNDLEATSLIKFFLHFSLWLYVPMAVKKCHLVPVNEKQITSIHLLCKFYTTCWSQSVNTSWLIAYFFITTDRVKWPKVIIKTESCVSWLSSFKTRHLKKMPILFNTFKMGWIQLCYIVRTFVNVTMYSQYINSIIKKKKRKKTENKWNDMDIVNIFVPSFISHQNLVPYYFSKPMCNMVSRTDC
jgi:hypothetical protein